MPDIQMLKLISFNILRIGLNTNNKAHNEDKNELYSLIAPQDKVILGFKKFLHNKILLLQKKVFFGKDNFITYLLTFVKAI